MRISVKLKIVNQENPFGESMLSIFRAFAHTLSLKNGKIPLNVITEWNEYSRVSSDLYINEIIHHV